MKQMKVLALGAAALTAGTLLISETALADGYRNAGLHARHGGRLGWWLANAGALNTNPYYDYFPTYSSPYAYVPYAYGPYGYGYGYGYPRGVPSLGHH
ncbi:MAG: hypothetical protein WB774_02455 [Xanthobacteraceae bacterium]|jgi:hypothetical protein